ncbi:MAG: hypothetical protein DHS20C02_02740 [Micavibrio sp.]|nr:MAG: hypothetical protein DHS20C02_02740 [Micavibrio sp.]
MRSFIAGCKLAVFAVLCVFIIIVQGAFVLLYKGPASYIMPRLWHNCVRMTFGIKYRIEGTPYTDSQTLYMSNHMSYLDIEVIGSVLKASFVAKAEVESWPLFGLLCKLQQTAFISRSRVDAAKETNALETTLNEGKSLIIFPEGTSTDGKSVLPFKSSLFSIAYIGDNKDMVVQPITVQLETVDGHAIETQDDRDLYAWHVDMTTELPDHLWRFAKTSGATVVLKFHPPIKASDINDRKILAKLCYEQVSKGLESTPALTQEQTQAA